MSSSERILSRDCQVTAIPAGDAATLPEGTKVLITHRLGGNFTVTCEWGMFRIAGKDGDAIGEKTQIETLSDAEEPSNKDQGPPSEEEIWKQLKGVYDPEIPVNIVDLGLVYSLDISEEDGQYKVNMSMTLTAPGCGMGPVIAEDAKEKMKSVSGVSDANVEIVWDPPWSQDMISEAGKMELGMI